MAEPFSDWPDQVGISEIDDADECGIPIHQERSRKRLLGIGIVALIFAIMFLMGLVRPYLP